MEADACCTSAAAAAAAAAELVRLPSIRAKDEFRSRNQGMLGESEEREKGAKGEGREKGDQALANSRTAAACEANKYKN